MEQCVVLDLGSTSLKAGFAGDDHPVALVDGSQGLHRKTTQKRFSEHFQNKVDQVGHPIVRGRVDDWEDLEYLWQYALDQELGVDPEASTVFLTTSPICSHRDREQMAEILFSKLNAKGGCIGSKSVMSLFSTGRTRGIVLQVGGGQTSSVPIFEGFPLRHATKMIEFAGEDMTNYLANQLGISLSADIVREIKEKTCWVKQRPKQGNAAGAGIAGAYSKSELGSSLSQKSGNSSVDEDSRVESHVKKAPSQSLGLPQEAPVSFELPDGQVVEVSVDSQRNTPEQLFQPDLNKDSTHTSLPKLCIESILSCDKTLQRDLYSSIVLAGGSSMFPGFATRLESELLSNSQVSTNNIAIIPDSQRRHASWIGASMLASIDTFSQISITRHEWEENGARVVHEKCIH